MSIILIDSPSTGYKMTKKSGAKKTKKRVRNDQKKNGYETARVRNDWLPLILVSNPLQTENVFKDPKGDNASV